MISKKYMLILGLLITVVGATSAKAKPLPPGSYKTTCRNIRWGGTYGTALLATCRTTRGAYRKTYIFPHKCESNRDIANRNGHLVCE